MGQNVWKSSEKVWKHGFPNFRNLRKIRNLFYSELSKNYEKMTLNSNFENREKLVWTQKFGLKFGMQGLTAKIAVVQQLQTIKKFDSILM